MKKILSLLSVLFLTFGCYDDSDIRNELRNHEERLAKLETLCKQMNTNISALQTIVSTLQKNVFVTAVTPIKEGSDIVGYAISFSNSESVTIYHGRDGVDGEDGTDGVNGTTPSIGVRQDTDGIYYWTLDGELLLDATGKKVQAVGRDGSDGAAGEDGAPGAPGQSGVTPQLKIVDGYWYVSYDGGKTWEEEPLGQATGDKGYTMFAEVTYDEEYLYITMADGEKLVLPRTSESQDEGEEQEGVSQIGPVKIRLSSVTSTTATFTGTITDADAIPYIEKIAVYYAEASETFSIISASSVSTVKINSDNTVSITIESLTHSAGYNYCLYVKSRGIETYSEIQSFTTLQHSLDVDLSSYASANCYIVSESGLYKFRAVKGNSSTPVGDVASASILWETFGTDVAPIPGDLISEVCYSDGYIAFEINTTFKEGNAVIAAKDANGTILWSWHIWLTDQPQSHVYKSNAGIMMDRNLGATSATPGDVGALGLLYQWGRKDPFLGSSSIWGNVEAKSTIAWPSAVSSDSSNGTIEYATAHPTTFIFDELLGGNHDWYYTGDSSTDNTRWTTSETAKSIYDPCPVGWRVPDCIWLNAGFAGTKYDRTNGGTSFSISSSTTWYPASGYRDFGDGSLVSLVSVGTVGLYWSVSPYYTNAYGLYFGDSLVDPACIGFRVRGQSVRCLQVIDGVAGANAEESK